MAQEDLESKTFDNHKDPYQSHNKHEKVFCCGRKGVSFVILNTTQFMYVFALLLVSFKAVTFSAELDETADDQSAFIVMVIILSLSAILALYLWIGIIPSILASFSVTTSIEMMKDREAIYKVVSIQRMQRSQRSFRVYQVLKLIRREMIVEFRKNIPDKKLNKDLQKHVVEAFLICGTPQDK